MSDTAPIRPPYAIPSIDQKDQPDVQPVEITGPITAVIDGEVHLDDSAIVAEIGLVVAAIVAGMPVTINGQPVTVHVDNATPATDVSGLLTNTQLRATPVDVLQLAQLVPVEYDEIDLSYTGDDLTGVEYKQATVTVATLTLAYTSSVLQSVVRT